MAMLLRRHRKARAAGVTTSENVTPTAEPSKALADMDKGELQAEAERRGLPKTGNKPALRERIEAHDAEQAERDEQAAARERVEAEHADYLANLSDENREATVDALVAGDYAFDGDGVLVDSDGEPVTFDESAEQGDGEANPEGDADDAADGDESDDE